MKLQTLAQRRAKHAWDACERFQQRSSPEDFEKNFADPSKKLPMRIRSAGLLQTLAFVLAKQEGTPAMEAVADWCYRQGLVPDAKPGTLRTECTRQDTAWLRQVTAETMAYLEWLVRFSEGLAKEQKTQEAHRDARN